MAEPGVGKYLRRRGLSFQRPDKRAVEQNPTRPQLATKTQVTRQVIQNRLPHRRLLGPGQHPMLTHAPPTRTRPQRLTPTVLPLRPPAVHRLERDLEHRRDVLAVPSLHQRGHRPQPQRFLRRRRQLPCVKHQFTHAAFNDPECSPFRINSRGAKEVSWPVRTTDNHVVELPGFTDVGRGVGV